MVGLIILEAADDTSLRAASYPSYSRIEPVLIEAGIYAGKFAVSDNVLARPELRFLASVLDRAVKTTVSIENTWPSRTADLANQELK